MKKQALLLVVVFVFVVGPTLSDAAAPQERADFEPKYDVDIWIDPNGWYHIYYTDLAAYNTIYVEIEVTSGPGIDFFICDQANWDIWDSGGTASVYNLNENVGSVSTSFYVPTTDTWYIVFDSDSYENIHVEGYVGLSPAPAATSPPPSTPDGSMMLIVVAVVAIIVIGVIGVAVVKQISGQSPAPPPTTQPVYSVQETSFCTYCGSPRPSPDAKFCSKCGRSFTGPEFE